MKTTRRHLLATASIAAFARGSLPWALSGGQGLNAPDLLKAWKQAQAAGRPLLVVVIPANRSHRYAYGRAWGAVLNAGSQDVRAALALCDLRCASYESVQTAFGKILAQEETPLPSDEPMGILLETERLSAHSVPVTAALSAQCNGDAQGHLDRSHKRRAKLAQDGLAELSTALHRAILPDAKALVRRAAQERAALPIDAARLPGAERAILAPAGLLAESGGATDGRWNPWEERIALEFDKRMQSSVPGAQWANSSGCGVRIEGEPSIVQISCGMGLVPEISRRFLYFYQN